MSLFTRQGRSIRRLPAILVLGAVTLGIAGCSTTSGPPEPPPPPVVQTLPPGFPPQDIVGSWGLAAYHRDEDRTRTETNASGQCRQPYVITLGPTGGVMMHLADQSVATELRLKGAPGGKTFIGPADEPPGAQQDREVVQFDGRVLILRWIDSEVQGRYGNMIYVRCGAEGAKKPPARRAAAKPGAKPAPRPAAAPKPPAPAR